MLPPPAAAPTHAASHASAEDSGWHPHWGAPGGFGTPPLPHAPSALFMPGTSVALALREPAHGSHASCPSGEAPESHTSSLP